MLSWLGSRCWTMTNAMPVGARARDSISRRASRPPAEAPMPTTGPVKAGAAPRRRSGRRRMPLGTVKEILFHRDRERELGWATVATVLAIVVSDPSMTRSLSERAAPRARDRVAEVGIVAASSSGCDRLTSNWEANRNCHRPGQVSRSLDM